MLLVSSVRKDECGSAEVVAWKSASVVVKAALIIPQIITALRLDLGMSPR
jgi:hypothetical protein